MKKKTLSIDDLLNIQRPTVRVPMHLSPDGRWLTVSIQSSREGGVSQEQMITKDGVPVEMLSSRVIIIDTTNGKEQESFPPDSTSWAAQWSPDGKLLAAYIQHEGMACLGIWDVKTKTYSLLREASVRVLFGFEIPQWTPDSKAIVVKLLPESGIVEETLQHHSSLDEPSVNVMSFVPFAKDKPRQTFYVEKVTEKFRCDLGLVDVGTGDVKRLVKDWRLSVWRMAPDGKAVALFRMVDATEQLQQIYCDLMVIPLNGVQPYSIANRLGTTFYGLNFSWSPNSRYIVYITVERGQPGHLFIVPMDGSEKPKNITSDEKLDLKQNYEAPRWSADGHLIYCFARNNVWEFAFDGSSRRQVILPNESQIRFWLQRPTETMLQISDSGKLPLVISNPTTKQESLAEVSLDSGQLAVLTQYTPTRSISSFAREITSDSSTYYLFIEAVDHPSAIYYAKKGHRTVHRFFSPNSYLDDVSLGTSRLIEYQTLDGEKRRAALLLPEGYTEGNKCPLIVWVYGGISGSESVFRFGLGNLYEGNAQLLASRGYAVLYPDMPMEPRDPLRQLPGLVLPAINHLVNQGVVDSERLGLMGHSYGGYCVLALLVQTTVFRAAVAAAPSGINLTSSYSKSVGWCESGQGQMGGTPWEKRDAYIENSPFFYLDRVQTPLLLLSGTEDKESSAQAEEAFTALRRLEKWVELRLYMGEGHWSGTWSENNIKDVCNRVLDWFDIHLKDSQNSKVMKQK